MNIQSQLQKYYGEALSVIINKVGDVQLAEDAMQEASIKALENWGVEMPSSPRAWLITVAYRYCLDGFRKQTTIDAFQNLESDESYSKLDAREIEDHLLQLIFMCCHPCISYENQIAMTLKLVMGFSVKDISRALVVPEKTIEQRLTRAKNKIDLVRIDFSLPHQSQMQKRLPSVLNTLYLIFNEGHQPTSGLSLVDEVLCNQAIRLMRSVCQLFRGQSDALALLALMLFVDARSPARGKTHFIALKDHDRSLYKLSQIEQADVILQKAFKLNDVSFYHIHASISALHSQAKQYDLTDWKQIELLYRKLIQYQSNDVNRLQLATVLIELKQYTEAKEILDASQLSLKKYNVFYVVKSQYFKKIGLIEESKNSLKQALLLSKNEIEKQYFQSCLKELNY